PGVRPERRGPRVRPRPRGALARGFDRARQRAPDAEPAPAHGPDRLAAPARGPDAPALAGGVRMGEAGAAPVGQPAKPAQRSRQGGAGGPGVELPAGPRILRPGPLGSGLGVLRPARRDGLRRRGPELRPGDLQPDPDPA